MFYAVKASLIIFTFIWILTNELRLRRPKQVRIYMYYGSGTGDRNASGKLADAAAYAPGRDGACAVTRRQHFSAWNDVMVAVLKVMRHIGNPTPYLREEQSCQISSRSYLKRRRLKLCPHCRRKVRLSPKTARKRRQSPNSATVALFCDSVDRALGFFAERRPSNKKNKKKNKMNSEMRPIPFP